MKLRSLAAPVNETRYATGLGRSRPAEPERRLLSGWGRTAPSVARRMRPPTSGELLGLLTRRWLGESSGTDDDPRAAHPSYGTMPGMIARGLGRSYGDAAQCAGGVVIDMSAFSTIGEIDPLTGLVEVGAGVSIDQLIRRSLPLGWFVPVSPGTRYVSIGGTIAADVHGKNHHRDGSFCAHVTSLTVITPTGAYTVSPTADAELFWATAGGMGLTGVIIGATVRLTCVETTTMTVDTQRFEDLDDLMAAMEASDASYGTRWPGSTARARRKGLGRAVLTRGDHAPLTALGPNERDHPLVSPKASTLAVPVPAPGQFANPGTVRV